MGKAADWLREERRKTLGDWVAFCLGCGHAQRYFDESEAEVAGGLPDVRRGDAASLSRLRGAIQLGVRGRVRRLRAPLRDPELFGTPIRKMGSQLVLALPARTRRLRR